jgi:hypothetical protein
VGSPGGCVGQQRGVLLVDVVGCDVGHLLCPESRKDLPVEQGLVEVHGPWLQRLAVPVRRVSSQAAE